MNCDFSTLKTPPELLEKLRRASKVVMTKEERFEQKVSFIFGSIKGVTKEEIKKVLQENCCC